ncbi:hypothetical protein SEA_PATOS_86 [Gordonia phage Patos]|uniref:Uncharacterized protein n=1 Tax=Gordonia phage Patos TaxID=2927262 RepID=A0A9E7QQL4_9CAUD|nr:hypothetical protein SEA_PATOS_86 [Gordonia phage Patos]WNN95340.1 hypothetical protein SEA_NORMANRE_86 [Gordonia phage NorManre]
MAELNIEQIQTLIASIGRMAVAMEDFAVAAKKSNEIAKKMLEAVTANGEAANDLVDLAASWPVAVPNEDGSDMILYPVADIIEMMAQKEEEGDDGE